jgi:hypothetical protein
MGRDGFSRNTAARKSPKAPVFSRMIPLPMRNAEGFLMLGASVWSPARQALFEQALKEQSPRGAGRQSGSGGTGGNGLSREPGHYAHRLANATGVEPVFFGKPFPAIFDMARSRIRPGVPDDRVLMVGDTLHTDILGGKAAGFRTALISGYGFFAGEDPSSAIAAPASCPISFSTGPEQQPSFPLNNPRPGNSGSFNRFASGLDAHQGGRSSTLYSGLSFCPVSTASGSASCPQPTRMSSGSRICHAATWPGRRQELVPWRNGAAARQQGHRRAARLCHHIGRLPRLHQGQQSQ